MSYADIFEAVKKGTTEDVRYFVEQKGTDVNTKDADGWIPLHHAAKSNSNVEVLKYLVSQGADVNAKSNVGKIPLHYAAGDNSNVDVSKYLVSKGSDVNAESDTGWTPLHSATLGSDPEAPSNIEAMKYLISRNANVNAKSKETEDKADLTPLHIATMKGSVEATEILIDAGADVNAISNTSGTPLNTAAMEGHIEVAKILIRKDPNVVKARLKKGITILHTAALNGNVEFAETLVFAGADINAESDGATPLDFAKEKGNTAMVQYLLNDELSHIEAVVSEWEKKIKDEGEEGHTVKNLKKQIEAVADADTVMAKINAGDNEWLDSWKKETLRLSGADKINILRLIKLKYQHPNNQRINELGSRAVKCYLKLCEINCTVTEEIADPDLRPQIRVENQKMMSELRNTYSKTFSQTEENCKVETTPSFTPSSKSANTIPVVENNSSPVKKVIVTLLLIVAGVIIGNMVFKSAKKETLVLDAKPVAGESLMEIDGKTYKTVKIGSQTWMAENLNTEKGNSLCYNNDPANCKKYGRYYDWETAMKACPSGWHLPNNEEWDALYRSVDGNSGTKSPYKSETAGKYLKSKEGWNDFKNQSGNGEDTYGFSAIPGGLGYSGGSFDDAGYRSDWWSSSEYDGYYAYYRSMVYNYKSAYWDVVDKSLLYSVRCVKD
ncbi:MAG: ankyrin repeat domain-containing protein [Fibromonadaceae bacterium]|jgi:uncharacterized protein (TIGR02145 family)|nr:ankyrin repeat domain-containing protein [Fibromonadaceae bacterium]